MSRLRVSMLVDRAPLVIDADQFRATPTSGRSTMERNSVCVVVQLPQEHCAARNDA